jgi:hypothetical protein
MKKFCIFVTLINLFLISCSTKPLPAIKPIVSELTFNSYEEALDFALKKKLLIQRFYENSSEPYFGKKEEKNCKDNIDIQGNVEVIPGGSYFTMQILANKYFAIGDCLLENNDYIGRYEYFICDKKVTEIKNYVEKTKPVPTKSRRACL